MQQEKAALFLDGPVGLGFLVSCSDELTPYNKRPDCRAGSPCGVTRLNGQVFPLTINPLPQTAWERRNPSPLHDKGEGKSPQRQRSFDKLRMTTRSAKSRTRRSASLRTGSGPTLRINFDSAPACPERSRRVWGFPPFDLAGARSEQDSRLLSEDSGQAPHATTGGTHCSTSNAGDQGLRHYRLSSRHSA
jgi:hypothetical protein